MTLRLMPFAAVAALAACGAAPSESAAQESGGRPFTVTEVATFDGPWALAFLPGSGLPLTGAALVTEKSGKLWLLDSATGRKQEVTGVPAVKDAGQGGLGDVVAHPGFAGNRRIYLSFVEPGPGGTSGAAVGGVVMRGAGASGNSGVGEALAARGAEARGSCATRLTSTAFMENPRYHLILRRAR